MTRDDVVRLLRSRRAELEGMGAAGLYLFGSLARAEADAASDVDLLVRAGDTAFSIFDLVNLRTYLHQLLGAPVDLHDYGGYLRLASFRSQVGEDLLAVF